MATQFDNMIQNAQFHDQANGVSVGGKSVISKVPNKAGRKPLGEISNSNSLKPPQNNVARKQQNPVDFAYFGDEKAVQKTTIPLNRNKSLPKAVKNATLTARKPLGDISNSTKPSVPQLSQKTKVKNVNAVEPGDPGIDKGFLHNHAECIKTQKQAVDMDYFLETIGHFKDSSLNVAQPLISLTEEDIDLDTEMPELLLDEYSPPTIKTNLQMKHKLSPPCKSPQSPSLHMQWSNAAALDFCLAETPTALKN